MRYSLLLLALATPLAAQEQQAADPSRAAVAAARSSWISAHNYIVRSAEQMSEANFAFKPVADHVARLPCLAVRRRGGLSVCVAHYSHGRDPDCARSC